jgi:hypothetical protein
MPPTRPPDTRDLTTVAQRRQASLEASRYALANRVFNAALPYFGPRTRMPLIYFRRRSPGGEFDVPRRYAAQAFSRHEEGDGLGMIAYPTGRDPWLHARAPWRGLPEPVKRQHFMDILLHELAHTQQDPTKIGNREHLWVEGGADAFAALARDAVARRMGLGQQAAMPFSPGYGPLFNQFLRRYGGGQALYGQFGRRPPPPPPVTHLPGAASARVGTIRGLPTWASQA